MSILPFKHDLSRESRFVAPKTGILTVRVRKTDPLQLGSAPGIPVASADQLAALEPLFRRNKPLYRAAERYFDGSLSHADEMRLRSALAAMAFARH